MHHTNFLMQRHIVTVYMYTCTLYVKDDEDDYDLQHKNRQHPPTLHHTNFADFIQFYGQDFDGILKKGRDY